MKFDWKTRVPSMEPISIDALFLRRVVGLTLLTMTGFIVCGIGLITLYGATQKAPPVVVVTEDGRAYFANTEDFKLNNLALERHMEDILYVLFTRTERPYSERLQYYCTPGLISRIERYYEGLSKKHPSGFFQSGKIVSAKLKKGYTTRMEVWFEILVESRSEYETTQNTFFINCQFLNGPPMPENPLGWILNSIVRVEKDDYFKEELDKELKNKTELSKNEK